MPSRLSGLVIAGVAAFGLVATAMPASAAPFDEAPSSAQAASPRLEADTVGLFGQSDPTYDGVYRQAVAIIGLVAVGERVPPTAVQWLLRQQCRNGSLAAFRPDTSAPCPIADPASYTGPDSNSTALAAMALGLLGTGTPKRDARALAATAARTWLSRTQLPGGGWSWIAGLAPDSVSTSMAITTLGRAGDARATRWLGRHMDVEAGCAMRFQAGMNPDPLSSAWTFLATQGSPTYRPIRGARVAASCPMDANSLVGSGAAIAASLVAGNGQIPSAYDPEATDWNGTALGTLGMTQRNGSLTAMRLGLAALESNVDAYVVIAGDDNPGALGTLLMVAHAARANPRDFGGQDLVTRLLATLRT